MRRPLRVIESVLNPLGLFLLVWGVAVTLYASGVRNGVFPLPATLTVVSVPLSVIVFTVGYLTWTLFRGLDRDPTSLPSDAGRPLTRRAAARALNLILGVGGIALLLEMYRLDAIARHFDTTWFELLTHPDVFRARLMAFIGENVFQASGTVMLLSITNSLFSIGFVLLGVFLHLDQSRRKYVYLVAFLAVSLAIGIMHLSRYETTSNILSLLFAYCLMRLQVRSIPEMSDRPARHFKFHVSYLRFLIPLAAVVLLFAAIDVLLRKSGEYDQPNRLRGLGFHFYWYIASPLAAFNEFVATFTGDFQWGRGTFFPLYKWLCRLHLAREAEVAVYGERALLPYMANVYTYLRPFYEDFGLLGVAIFPYLLGWAIAAIRDRARRCFQFLNLYIVLLLLVVFSFYNYSLVSNQAYLQIAFGLVLFRYRIDLNGTAGYKKTAEWNCTRGSA